MSKDPELFYLVEYQNDNHIYNRWLFRTNEQAKNHIKKELYCEYNKKTRNWDSPDHGMFAKIYTLVI